MKAGEKVLLSWASANRDAAVWGPTADEYDLFRPKRTHAAFGFGTHYCSGHHFSRVQMRIALTRLLERLPGLRLAADGRVQELRLECGGQEWCGRRDELELLL